jgi:proline iminopeptidase
MKKITTLIIILLLTTVKLFAQDKKYEEWYLTTKDTVEIFVKEIKGGNDTVIVVHGGFGANHDYMLDAIKGLESKFHFILYDQRGSLMSPAPKEKLTFQKNVNDLFELVTELKLKKVKLLCHSMGTLVGMEFVKQHPEVISNVVLCGAVIPKSDSSASVFSERVTKQLDFLTTREEVNKLKQPLKDKRQLLSQKERTEYWRINYAAGNIYQIKKWRLLKGGRSYYKTEPSLMTETLNWDYDYRSILNSYGKVTIIQGQFDFLDFNGEIYKSQILDYNSISYITIPKAGHISWVDQPTLFKKTLISGLTK